MCARIFLFLFCVNCAEVRSSEPESMPSTGFGCVEQSGFLTTSWMSLSELELLVGCAVTKGLHLTVWSWHSWSTF